MVRRRPGTLLPLEVAILATVADATRAGPGELHGFAVAKQIQERDGARRLTAHGTLYKALDRLQGMGLLESRWEDPVAAADEGRPRRRLYSVTGAGATTLAALRAEGAPTSWRPRPGVAPA